MTNITLGVSGSRSIKDPSIVNYVLGWVLKRLEAHAQTVTAVVHGGADGVDTLADHFFTLRGLKPEILRPDYKAFPRRVAPLKRDEEVVKKVDILVAIWDGESRGTKYTFEFAAKQNKKALVCVWDAKERVIVITTNESIIFD